MYEVSVADQKVSFDLPPPPGRGFHAPVTSHLEIAILDAKGCLYAPRQIARG